jgi:hypothetical protein
MEVVNAVMFHQLEDNLSCQGMDAEVATGFSTKPDTLAEVTDFLGINLLPCYFNAGVQCIS